MYQREPMDDLSDELMVGRASSADSHIGSRRRQRQAPAVADQVVGLRRWVAGLAAASGASKTEQADIALAVSEALSNAVLHAYPEAQEPGPMRVEAYLDNSRFVVEVADEGEGLRPRLDSPGGGLGLSLIAALAESLEIMGGGGGRGARLRMRFGIAGLD